MFNDLMLVLFGGSTKAASVALLVNSFLLTSILFKEGVLTFRIVMEGVLLVDPASLFDLLI